MQVYASTTEGHAYMSQATLALKTGLGERTVRQHLAEAERFGFIHRERNYDAPSDTWITCPVGLAARARIGIRDTLHDPSANT
ncbi:helix-turn-helix domain-containing protein [Arthrobacter rhombi]|uniref:helix-turn-helix domain-containing protein n=1 Tax=Arthrobacter rhombi TaxID=71253 RepID=UPI003FD1CFD9